MTITVLAVGDVCGEPGLRYLEKHLKALKKQRGVAFCVVNGENANVVGVTPDQCRRILEAGADCVTLGNHTWTRWELQPYLNEAAAVIRPANYAPQCPGRGMAEFETPFGKICVLNLLGRFTLDANTDNPFVAADNLLSGTEAKMILVDFHAEGTSEKLAMGFFLEGRVSAVWGTHTHVQTSDAQVFDGGTGYITDLGMTGPAVSVLGIDPTQSVNKFLGDPPRRYKSAAGESKLEGALFEIDPETGRCQRAEAIRIM